MSVSCLNSSLYKSINFNGLQLCDFVPLVLISTFAEEGFPLSWAVLETNAILLEELEESITCLKKEGRQQQMLD